jgi:HPt (histidine-containing phosphotransfer) domain-containing protein
MDGYLSKPIDRLELFEAVEMGSPAAPATVTREFDYLDLLDRLGGDEAIVADVLEIFLADSARLLGALRAAVASRNAAALCDAAHELKGAAGNIAAGGVVQGARALEILGRHGVLDSAPETLARLERDMASLCDAIRLAMRTVANV